MALTSIDRLPPNWAAELMVTPPSPLLFNYDLASGRDRNAVFEWYVPWWRRLMWQISDFWTHEIGGVPREVVTRYSDIQTVIDRPDNRIDSRVWTGR